MIKIIYVAVEEDGQVLHVSETKELLEKYVLDWFGINPDKNYSHPDEFLGYFPFDYPEFEDDVKGYYTFKDSSGKLTRVYLWEKVLNENC
jgi:hypothetical protein